MSMTSIGLIGLSCLFALLALRFPVALSMILVGVMGTIAATMHRFSALGMSADLAFDRGLRTSMSNLSGEAFEAVSNYNLLVIPLFVLMGNLAGVSGMSRDLFNAAYSWMGHRRGGLASATIAACAGFAALSGSSLASAITMGRVALPQMKRYNYADSLATGAVAAGGTLGFLIPPSGGMIIYAVLTEQSIGRLFMAGVIPGLLMTLLFIGAISLVVAHKPEAGPAGDKAPWDERRRALVAALPIVSVIAITIGGMYSGFFTPVEAAGVGALLAFIVALVRRSLTLRSFPEVVLQTLKASGTVFMILIGAYIFIPFMSMTELPSQLVTYMTSLDIGDFGVLFLIILIYIFLGMFLEGIAMLVLTIPVVLPIVAALDFGFDPAMADMKMIWFGIIVVIVLEMGMISPPVGLNVFVVKSIAPGVSMGTIFRGIWPFWFAMALMIVLLVIFPQIAIWLPQQMI